MGRISIACFAKVRQVRLLHIASCLLLSLTAEPNLYAGVISEFTSQSSFQSSTAGTTNIAFDTFQGGDILSGSEYSAQGLSIQHRDGQQLQILNSTFGFTQYHNLNINSSPNGLSSGGNTENIDFTFTNGASAAGLWVGNIGDLDGSNNPNYFDDTNGTWVQFIGVSGSVLAQKFLRTDTSGIIIGASPPNNRIFYGISYSGSLQGIDPIKTIRVLEGADGESVVFDNVQFSAFAATVPEPTIFIGLSFLVGGYVVKGRFWRKAKRIFPEVP
jgi:hypothetical protein